MIPDMKILWRVNWGTDDTEIRNNTGHLACSPPTAAHVDPQKDSAV